MLGIALAIGIVVGIFAIFHPLMDYQRISQSLLDQNIINHASPNRGIFGFVFARLLEVALGVILVILFNMTKWTFLLTFPYLALRGFWMVINLFWIADRFGFLHGLPLLIVYTVILLAVCVLFLCLCVFLLKRGQHIRKFGFRGGFRWREIKNTAITMLIITLAIGAIEWLLYFTILGRLVYII